MDLASTSTRTLQLALAGVLLLAWAAQFAGTGAYRGGWGRLLPLVLGLFSALQIGLVIYLWLNHAAFPLNLEAMELTVLATVRRIQEGLPIYVPPTSDFTPLAYNPLYYLVSIPFTWMFGPGLLALRLSAIIGMLGCGVVLYLAVRHETGSIWWGLLAVGLFAAAYRAMDTYLDNAHADSWMLFTALLAAYWISLERSRTLNLLAVGIGVASFWFKQPGAAFAAGALAFLTLREGIRRAWTYWVVAIAFGPVLYALIPARWAGPWLHEYTWSIPRHWLSLNLGSLRRLVGYHARAYALLAVASGIGWIVNLSKARLRSVWFFLLPFAALTALSGAMDSESNNNVFIPLGTWLILTGVLALHEATKHTSWVNRGRVPSLVLGASFVLLVYNPFPVLVSPQAGDAYSDFQAYLGSLDGPVYAPWIGPLQDGYAFTPAIHWVPMTDVVRRPGKDLPADPLIRSLLDPVVHPAGRAYILTNIPLEQDSALSFLTGEYVLAMDLGARFQALSTLPKRYELGWPRYLYAYRGG